MSKYKVPHFDAKGELTSFYWEDFIFFGAGPKRGPDVNAVFCGARSLEVSRALNPSLQTFERWLAENKANIPLA